MNSLMFMTDSEYQFNCKDFELSYNIIEIDLSLVTDEQTYLDYIGELFSFPIFPGQKGHSWNGYFDWMRDLSWIFDSEISHNKTGVFLVFRNYGELINQPNGDDLYKKIIDSYVYTILPWWAYEVENCVVGGCRRNFVICIIYNEDAS